MTQGAATYCTALHKKCSKRTTENLCDRHWLVLLREISCNFVDRVLRIRSHEIHEIRLSYTKEHEIRVFVQSRIEPTLRRLNAEAENARDKLYQTVAG
jgi:hypothetical protein